jgi:hypothetical protein
VELHMIRINFSKFCFLVLQTSRYLFIYDRLQLVIECISDRYFSNNRKQFILSFKDGVSHPSPSSSGLYLIVKELTWLLRGCKSTSSQPSTCWSRLRRSRDGSAYFRLRVSVSPIPQSSNKYTIPFLLAQIHS